MRVRIVHKVRAEMQAERETIDMSKKFRPAELDQDAGSGYNADRSFIQE